ncbi:MAG: hypothetical protein EOO87_06190 [Pedobacter sp.]|nr:MAG: hypothetical protein EOO87_06190 [Pedobacter sp.]
MKKVEILVVGTNKAIMQTIARLINENEEWVAIIANNYEEACSFCLDKELGLVLIGAGLKEIEEMELKQYVSATKPALPIVKHYGGGSGLLFAEIYQAIG